MKIVGQEKLHHLTGVPEPPWSDESEYAQWEQDDLIVCSWMLHNMEPDLVHHYAQFPTAKELWKSLLAMYIKGKDGVQQGQRFVRMNNTK